MFENGMDIIIRCILLKKCLDFDYIYFVIIMLMFFVYENWVALYLVF